MLALTMPKQLLPRTPVKRHISHARFECLCHTQQNHLFHCIGDGMCVKNLVCLLICSFLPFFLLFVYRLEPLPVSSVSIYDYKPSPETGVLFEIQYPEKYNVFTRVNISYWEGKDYRTMLYKGRRKLFYYNLMLTLPETF